jgi:hypothetical protein
MAMLAWVTMGLAIWHTDRCACLRPAGLSGTLSTQTGVPNGVVVA